MPTTASRTQRRDERRGPAGAVPCGHHADRPRPARHAARTADAAAAGERAAHRDRHNDLLQIGHGPDPAGRGLRRRQGAASEPADPGRGPVHRGQERRPLPRGRRQREHLGPGVRGVHLRPDDHGADQRPGRADRVRGLQDARHRADDPQPVPPHGRCGRPRPERRRRAVDRRGGPRAGAHGLLRQHPQRQLQRQGGAAGRAGNEGRRADHEVRPDEPEQRVALDRPGGPVHDPAVPGGLRGAPARQGRGPGLPYRPGEQDVEDGQGADRRTGRGPRLALLPSAPRASRCSGSSRSCTTPPGWPPC